MVLTKAQEIDVKNISQEILKECLFDKTFMHTFASQISDIVIKNLCVEFDKVNKLINCLEIRLNNVEEENKIIISENKALLSKLNALEQQKSNDNLPGCSESATTQTRINDLEQNAKLLQLRVFNVPEERSENLNDILLTIFNKKLGINSCQIDKCYRIGPLKTNDNKKWPILVKFRSMHDRNNIFYNKKKLKGSKIVIAEELIKPRFELLKLAKEKLGKFKVWSKEGLIATEVNRKICYNT